MFYCDKCRLKNKWPDSLSRSSGRCEVCGKTANCNDVPTSALPRPEKRSQDSEIAEHAVTGSGGTGHMTDQHRELVSKLADLRKMVDTATLTPWRSTESKDYWSLHGEARAYKGKGEPSPSMQILRVPKHGMPYAEYWPSSADTAVMIESANRFSFWLDWADDVASRHYPVVCGCRETHFLCAAHRMYSWESCPEVIGMIRAVDMLHRCWT